MNLKAFSQLEKNNGESNLIQVAAELGKTPNLILPLPGRIYSLRIKSPLPDLNEETVPLINFNRQYYDLNPVGLCLYNENFRQVCLFLNFKVIPPQILRKLLEAYYELSKQNGLTSLYNQQGELISLEKRQLLDKRFYFLTSTILSNLLGLKSLNYAINKYDTSLIEGIKLIDWDNYGKLVNAKITDIGFYPKPFNVNDMFNAFIESSIKDL